MTHSLYHLSKNHQCYHIKHLFIVHSFCKTFDIILDKTQNFSNSIFIEMKDYDRVRPNDAADTVFI